MYSWVVGADAIFPKPPEIIDPFEYSAIDDLAWNFRGCTWVSKISNLGQNRISANTYDFSKQGITGLKAAISYISGRDIKDANGSGSEYKEWERDYRFDYTVPTGTLKGLGFTVWRANLRTNIPGSQGGADTDQTRFYINYSYAFM